MREQEQIVLCCKIPVIVDVKSLFFLWYEKYTFSTIHLFFN